MKHIQIYFILLAIIWMTACKKFIEVPAPQTLIDSSTVFGDPKAATSAQVGLYLTLENQTPYQMGRYLGSYTDELTNLDGGDFNNNCYLNSLNPNLYTKVWENYFKVVAQANQIISGLSNSTKIGSVVKNQLLGESKFCRAFVYFNLINIFGDVPLVLSTDYRQNIQLPRATQARVYQQIVADLKEAESLLSNNYVGANSISSTTDRIRPTKWAAKALLARVYLYNKDFSNADAKASEVINNSTLYELDTDLEKVFLKYDQYASDPNKEAIWQMDIQQTNYYYSQGYSYYPQYGIGSFGDNSSSAISPQLLNTFETNDQRKQKWVFDYDNFGTIYSIPYKYKNATYGNIPLENETVLRLAEQYLIRAEARNENNDATGAKTDLNKIRSRAGLSDYAGASDKTSLAAAILHERQVELFCEWGHRFFDLKRTGKINTVMSTVAPIKGGTWSSYKQLWPIPYSDIKLNRNLSQNPGYN